MATSAGTDALSEVFSALADPTRRAMIARLSRGEATVNQLAEPFLADMSLPAVTKHLKVLERARLITKTRQAQFRPCTLNGPTLKEATDWLEEYRAFWEASFDRLDAFLKQNQQRKEDTLHAADSNHPADRKTRRNKGAPRGRKK